MPAAGSPGPFLFPDRRWAGGPVDHEGTGGGEFAAVARPGAIADRAIVKIIEDAERAGWLASGATPRSAQTSESPVRAGVPGVPPPARGVLGPTPPPPRPRPGAHTAGRSAGGGKERGRQAAGGKGGLPVSPPTPPPLSLDGGTPWPAQQRLSPRRVFWRVEGPPGPGQLASVAGCDTGAGPLGPGSFRVFRLRRAHGHGKARYALGWTVTAIDSDGPPRSGSPGWFSSPAGGRRPCPGASAAAAALEHGDGRGRAMVTRRFAATCLSLPGRLSVHIRVGPRHAGQPRQPAVDAGWSLSRASPPTMAPRRNAAPLLVSL
jgi:hypothetical protein